MSDFLESARIGLGRMAKGHSVTGWKVKSVPAEEKYKYKPENILGPDPLDPSMYQVKYRMELGQNGQPVWIDPSCLTDEGKREEGVDTWGQVVRVVGTILTKEFLYQLDKDYGGRLWKKKNLKSPLKEMQKRRQAREAAMYGKIEKKKSDHRKTASIKKGQGTPSRHGATVGKGPHGRTTAPGRPAAPGRPTAPGRPAAPAGRSAVARPTASSRPAVAKPAATKSVSSVKKSSSSKSSKKSSGFSLGGKKRR